MNIVCDVVRDLLPLYYDGVCSESTKQLVEDHVRNCTECEEEFRLMCGDIGTDTPPVAEEMIARAVTNAWKKSVKKESKEQLRLFFISGVVPCVCTLLGFLLFWASYASGGNPEALADLAEKHLGYDHLVIDAMDQDGECMAVLCSDAEGIQHLLMYKREPIGYNRWKPTGEEYDVSNGELSSWTHLTPSGKNALVICGINLSEDACWYTYQVDGVVYTCPIENHSVVDVLIIEEGEEINSLPAVLKTEQK